MSRVLFLLADDFEDVEFRHPYDRLLAVGHDLVVAGAREGESVTGKRHQETVTLDAAAGEVDVSSFDVLVVPGGYSPDKLRLQPAAVRIVHEFDTAGKPIGAVCHAPSLLIDAAVTKGRRLTSWPSIRVDLVNAGAEWVDAELVRDGNLITSRKPEDLDRFTAELLVAAG